MRPPRLDRACSIAWRLPLAVLAALPVVSFFVSPGPAAAKALVAALLAAAALRPADAWPLAAALAPLGALLGEWLGSGNSLTEPLVLAFLAGWLAHEAARAVAGAAERPGADRTALALALLLGLTVLASLLVRLAAHHLTVDFPIPYLGALYHFLWHDYFGGPSRFRTPIVPAARFLEAVGLFVATLALYGRCPRFGTRGARALASSAGIAALAAVVPLASKASALGWGAAFPRGIATSRVSTVGRDVNAAGSFYALAFGVTAGLVAVDRRFRLPWGLVGILTLAGLWLTGSRLGLAAMALVAVVMAAALGARRKGRAAVAAAAVAVGLVVFVGGFLYSTAAVRTRAAVALEWRVQHGTTALRMFAAHPVFGAGVGRFYALSPEYASPDWGRRGNAHNNFLQILAELGLVGLALLAGLVGRVLWRTWRARDVLRSDPLAACLAGGVLAYVLTWFAGHPLLVFEAAAPFWLALGLLAGMTAPRAPEMGPGPISHVDLNNAFVIETGMRNGAWPHFLRRRAVVWLLALGIALSVIPRARAEIRQDDLSGAAMGCSAVHRDARDIRFRWMAKRAQLFVPATAREVVVPLRSPAGPATVRLLVGGRVVARLVVEGRWREALVSLPAVEGRRFVPLELRASVMPAEVPGHGAGTTDTRVQVGMPRTVR